jgi:hypothetical protein
MSREEETIKWRNVFEIEPPRTKERSAPLLVEKELIGPSPASFVDHAI